MLILVLAAAVAFASQASAADGVSFSRDIRPILEARCLKCHGPSMQMAKLDLSTRESALKGGEKGPAFVEQQPDNSSLYRRVAGHEKPVMPMDGKLTDKEIALIREWIAQGAAWDAPVQAPAAKTEDLTALET